ncbi:MAG TPA: type I-C CRISPR-associated protein Cas7/Csd2 [Eubacteriales bacterium]|jgi:CRISPR-associated protein Csd2|nr:type I-C CRISPR-associated protein Cas7/Csd2 [Eubacteriales bacterium]HRU84687.1 type I-C CRISPR-associated protein Cas7/Csd2 [Eubacteriales bacterium]
MMNNKIDFAVVFTVKNANPNGDPLGGNRPRTTSDGFGEVSDVCLKRKLRNRLQDFGEKIFVQMDERCDDGKKSLSDRFNEFIKGKQKSDISAEVCKEWFDVRAFGQVFAFKKGDGVEQVSIGIRGPVTIQSAFSLEPVLVESIQITKSVNSETTEDGKKSSDTMGAKHRVNKAVYVTYGSISPQLAERTGFSDADAEKIKEALISLFEGDESSARPSGSMVVEKVIWFKHNSKSGQYSSAKVHKSVKVDKNGNVTVEPLEGLVPEVI